MGYFHDFTAPLRELFAGNLLFFLCCLFYLAWWLICFKPGASAGSAGGIFLAFAFLTGIAAVITLSASIRALAPLSKTLPVRYILLGAAAAYLILLAVTVSFFHRPATSELLIMHIWAALELAAVAVLHGTGRFGAGRAGTLTALVGAATAAGVICYVLYYRLGSTASYVDGMVPLASDALVTAAFLGILAVS
jgi:hypothetical protein